MPVDTAAPDLTVAVDGAILSGKAGVFFTDRIGVRRQDLRPDVAQPIPGYSNDKLVGLRRLVGEAGAYPRPPAGGGSVSPVHRRVPALAPHSSHRRRRGRPVVLQAAQQTTLGHRQPAGLRTPFAKEPAALVHRHGFLCQLYVMSWISYGYNDHSPPGRVERERLSLHAHLDIGDDGTDHVETKERMQDHMADHGGPGQPSLTACL